MIDIILMTHNRLEDTKLCVAALEQNTAVPFKLTVIDDSTDGTQEYFKGRDVTYIRKENIKCANQVVNEGMRQTQSPFVAFVGNTTFVGRNWLKESIEMMEVDKQIGLVGFCVIDPSTNFVQTGSKLINEYDERFYPPEWIYRTNSVPWSAVLIRREALPPLDEDLFIGFRGGDDLDNCLEMRDNGWDIIYNGHEVVYHTLSSSVAPPNDKEPAIAENAKNLFLKWQRRRPDLLGGGRDENWFWARAMELR